MEGVKVEVYDGGAYREASLVDIFEDEVVVIFQNETLRNTFDINLVRLPPSCSLNESSSFTVGQDVELFAQVSKRALHLGWWHAVVKKITSSHIEVEVLNGGNCTLYCAEDLLRPRNTNPPVNSKTIIKFEIEVPLEAREYSAAPDTHKEFQKAIKAEICKYSTDRGVLIIITSHKKTKKLVNTLKTMHFNNLAQKNQNDQKNEQEHLPMAESANRQMHAEFEAACVSLEEILKCPICLDYLEPPVGQCVRGHAVCGTCKGQLTVCPLCREQFINYTASVLSQVVKVFPRYCKYRLEGCTVVVRSSDSHKEYCQFRPTKCLLCDKTVAVNSLLSHYQIIHNEANQRDVSSGVMDLKLTVTTVNFNLFSCFNQLFWRKVNVDVENKLFSITFVRIPNEDINSKYYAKIKLKKGNSKYSSHTVIPIALKEFNMDTFPANIMIPLETMAQVMTSFANSTDELLAFDLHITETN